jgi:hypothetical protein
MCKTTDLRELIDTELARLRDESSSSGKVFLESNIIHLLAAEDRVANNSEIYARIKQLLKYAHENAMENRFNYDHISVENLKTCVSYLENEKRTNIFNYIKSFSKQTGLSTVEKWSENELQLIEIEHAKKSCNYLKLLVLLSSKSKGSILLTFFGVYICVVIALLPSPCDGMLIFKFNCVDYSSNPIVNHLINALSVLFNISGSHNFEPVNGVGVTVIVIVKLFFFLYVMSFLFEKLKMKVSEK